MIQSIRIVRHTSNYQKMRAFYQDGLDMRPLAEWDRGPEEKGAVLVFTGRTSTTAVEVLTHPGAPGGGGPANGAAAGGASTGVTVLLEVDNVGAQYEEVQARGVPVTREPANMPWGHRTFTVTDPDGLEISFFQDMHKPE